LAASPSWQALDTDAATSTGNDEGYINEESAPRKHGSLRTGEGWDHGASKLGDGEDDFWVRPTASGALISKSDLPGAVQQSFSASIRNVEMSVVPGNSANIKMGKDSKADPSSVSAVMQKSSSAVNAPKNGKHLQGQIERHKAYAKVIRLID